MPPLEIVKIEQGFAVPYALNTMVETPAAAISGSEIVPALRAKVAGYDDDVHPVYGFASFGTNDLTQTTLAISRDDAYRFLPLYVDKEFFERHPFISIHPAVEKMVRTFVKDVSSSPRLGLSLNHQGRSMPVYKPEKVDEVRAHPLYLI